MSRTQTDFYNNLIGLLCPYFDDIRQLPVFRITHGGDDLGIHMTPQGAIASLYSPSTGAVLDAYARTPYDLLSTPTAEGRKLLNPHWIFFINGYVVRHDADLPAAPGDHRPFVGNGILSETLIQLTR